jgi:toxin ParE1/3/4
MDKLRMAPKAFEDLQDAVRWYEKRSRGAADRFCRAIDAALDAIVETPRLFAKWDDDYRYVLLQRFPYYVIYRLDGDIVTVTAIRHTSRDLPFLE